MRGIKKVEFVEAIGRLSVMPSLSCSLREVRSPYFWQVW